MTADGQHPIGRIETGGSRLDLGEIGSGGRLEVSSRGALAAAADRRARVG